MMSTAPGRRATGPGIWAAAQDLPATPRPVAYASMVRDLCGGCCLEPFQRAQTHPWASSLGSSCWTNPVPERDLRIILAGLGGDDRYQELHEKGQLGIQRHEGDRAGDCRPVSDHASLSSAIRGEVPHMDGATAQQINGCVWQNNIHVKMFHAVNLNSQCSSTKF